jgi:hypothetical protein
MITCQKQSPPAHFLRFGVDDHGVIVMQLRQPKVATLRLELMVRQLCVRWKHGSRLR